MNQIVYNLMLINFSGMIFYILYMIFTKIKKENNIEILFNKSSDNYIQYKKIIKKYITVYIIGILVGLMFLILNEKSTVKVSVIKPIISDVDDIFVK